MEKCFNINEIDLCQILTIVFHADDDRQGDFTFRPETNAFDANNLGHIVKGFIVRYQWNALVDKKRRTAVNTYLEQPRAIKKAPLGKLEAFEEKSDNKDNILYYTSLRNSYVYDCYWDHLKPKFKKEETCGQVYEETYQIAMAMSGILEHIFADPIVAPTLSKRYNYKPTEYERAIGDEATTIAKAHVCDHHSLLPRTQISPINFRRVLDPELVAIAAFMAFAIYDTSTLNNFRVLLDREGMEAEDMHPSYHSETQTAFFMYEVWNQEARDSPNPCRLFEATYNSGKLFVHHMIIPANRFFNGLTNFLDFRGRILKPHLKERMKGLLFRKVCSELVQAYATHGLYPSIEWRMILRHPWLTYINRTLASAVLASPDPEKRYSFIQLMVEFVLLALEKKVLLVTMTHAYVKQGTCTQFVDLRNRKQTVVPPKMHEINFLFKIDPALHGMPAWRKKWWTFNELVNIIMIGSPDPFTTAFSKDTYYMTFSSKLPNENGLVDRDPQYILMEFHVGQVKLYEFKTDKDIVKKAEKAQKASTKRKKAIEGVEGEPGLIKKSKRRRKKQNSLETDAPAPDLDEGPANLDEEDEELDKDDEVVDTEDDYFNEDGEDERKPAAKETVKPAGTSEGPVELPYDVLAEHTRGYNFFANSCDLAVQWVNCCGFEKRSGDEDTAYDYVTKLRSVQKMALAVSIMAAAQINALVRGKTVWFGEEDRARNVTDLISTLENFDCSGVTAGNNKVKWKGKYNKQKHNPISFVHSKILNPISQAVAEEVIENDNKDKSCFVSQDNSICHFEKCKSWMTKRVVETPKGKTSRVEEPAASTPKKRTTRVEKGAVSTPKKKPREEQKGEEQDKAGELTTPPPLMEKRIPKKTRAATSAGSQIMTPPGLRRSDRNTPAKK